MKARTFAQRQKDKPSESYGLTLGEKRLVLALQKGKTLSVLCTNADIVHIEDTSHAMPYS